MTWWHGGPRIEGDRIEFDPSRTRSDVDGGVYITPSRNLAAMYASTVEGTAWIYEVEPDDEPVPDEDSMLTDESFRCSGATILRRYTISNHERSLRLTTITNINHMLGAL